MNRVGRLLIYVAGALTLSVSARADSPVAPTPNVNGLSLPAGQMSLMARTNLMNRMMLMKKHHHMQNMPGFPHFPNAGQTRQTTLQTEKANLPTANVSLLSIGGSVAAKDAPAKSEPASDNPYQSIVTRNVFGLNPVPPQNSVTQQPGPPPPKITLTGITTIFGPAEALFKVAGVVRSGGPPKDQSYIFTEGEAEDDVEVTKIDTQKNIVTFMNHGVEQEIPLADGVASSGSSPSAPSWPGQNNFGGGRFGRRLPPALQQRMQQYGGGNGFNPGSGFNPNGNGGMNPNGFSGTYNNYNNNPTASSTANLSPDDQAALIAAERAAAQSQGNSVLPNILPPTPQYDDQAKTALK